MSASLKSIVYLTAVNHGKIYKIHLLLMLLSPLRFAIVHQQRRTLLKNKLNIEDIQVFGINMPFIHRV